MRSLIARWTVLSGLALALVGCTHRNEDETLDVLLVNLAQGGSSGVGDVSFNCILRLENASPDALQVVGGAYKVYLDGIYLGEALTHEPIAVPGLGGATQTVNMNLSTFRLAASLYRVFESHKANYRLTSTVYTDRGGRRVTFRLDKRGSIDLDELQRAAGGPPGPNPAPTP